MTIAHDNKQFLKNGFCENENIKHDLSRDTKS